MRDNAEKRAQKIMEAAWIESGSIVRIMYTTRKLDKRQTLARKRIYYLTTCKISSGTENLEIKKICYWSALIDWSSQSEKRP